VVGEDSDLLDKLFDQRLIKLCNASFLSGDEVLQFLDSVHDFFQAADKEYQFDYVVIVADVSCLIEFVLRMSHYKLMELYSKKSGIFHGSRLLNKKSAA